MTITNHNPPRPPAPHRVVLLVSGALLGLLALAMYRPWIPRPFDIRDFSEFLPLLRGHDSLLGRFGALVGYYAGEHGRINLASYFALALKWSLLGPSPVLWQWARAAEMGLIVAATVHLFRRLGLGVLGALGGASIFILARTAAEGWTRMTMGEPLGLLCTLGALILATYWRESRRPLIVAGAAGVMMLVAVLAKEMLAGVLPLVWLVGTGRQEDGMLGPPVLDPQGRRFLFWSGAPALGGFLAAALIALGGGSEGFTAMYGHGEGRVVEFLLLLFRPWLIQGVAIQWNALLLPGNAILALVIVAGTLLGVRSPTRRPTFLWAWAAALALSLAYAVLYIPWPYSNLYYAMPFLLGVGLLFGTALDTIAATGVAGRRWALAAWVGMIVGMAPATAQSAAFAIALQQVNGDVAETLTRIPNADRIVVARTGIPPQAWMGTGPTLRRYALATGMATSLPPAMDQRCPDVGALLQHGIGRTVVVTFTPGCGIFDHPSFSHVRSYAYLWVWWDGAGMSTDSVRADLLVTAAAMSSRPTAAR